MRSLAALVVAAALGQRSAAELISGASQFSPAYLFSWEVDTALRTVSLTLDVATDGGWVGFGIGELSSGSMPGSDIMVFASDSPTGAAPDSVKDHHALGFFTPLVDTDDNEQWTLVDSSVADGRTVVTVSRPLDVDDCVKQDRPIPEGAVNVIGAFGTTPFLSYHFSNRFAQQVVFYAADGSSGVAALDYPETDAEVVEVRFPPTPVPTDETSYHCLSIDMREFTGSTPKHVIAVETLWNTDEGADDLLHHWTFARCVSATRSRWPLYQKAGRCDFEWREEEFGDDDEDPYFGCLEILAAWAPGIGAIDYPDPAGLLSDPADAGTNVYMFLELHIDNPQNLEGLSFDAGLRLHMTPSLRANDIGVLTLGDVLVAAPDLPPGEPEFHMETSCPSVCTRRFDEPINVFSTFLHMHKAGKKMWNSLHRDPLDEGETFARVDFYDFNFQRVVQHPEPIVVHPGDQISTHCVYDTTGRSEPTEFGEASSDEMCLSFSGVYPRQEEVALCGSGGGLTFCGDLTQLNDIIPRANPGRDAEGIAELPTEFGAEDTCDLVTISGLVFYDENGDGERNKDELLLGLALVKAFGDAEDSAVFRADVNGFFELDPLPPGEYVVGSRDRRQLGEGSVNAGLVTEDLFVEIPVVLLE